MGFIKKIGNLKKSIDLKKKFPYLQTIHRPKKKRKTEKEKGKRIKEE